MAQVIVVKDYKWQDESNTDNLYFLALFRDLAVRSLRDLRSCHVAALRCAHCYAAMHLKRLEYDGIVRSVVSFCY